MNHVRIFCDTGLFGWKPCIFAGALTPKEVEALTLLVKRVRKLSFEVGK